MTEIRYLGVAAFEITNSHGFKIIIDPYLDENPFAAVKSDQLSKVDLMLVTHAAYDHIGDAAKIAKRLETPIVCGADVKAHLLKDGIAPDKLIQVVWGLTIEHAGIRIRSVESRHWSNMTRPDGAFYSGPPMGFILEPDPGVKIYHCGDTALFSDLKLLGETCRPNIGLLNVSDPDIGSVDLGSHTSLLTGEMTPYEAALAAQWLGLEYAIPIHFGNMNKDVETFVELLTRASSSGGPCVKPIVLKPGEAFNYKTDHDKIR